MFMNKRPMKVGHVSDFSRQIYKKHDSAESLFVCKRQRNLSLKFLRKWKQDIWNDLNVKRIIDNRTFMRTMKPRDSELCNN